MAVLFAGGPPGTRLFRCLPSCLPVARSWHRLYIASARLPLRRQSQTCSGLRAAAALSAAPLAIEQLAYGTSRLSGRALGHGGVGPCARGAHSPLASLGGLSSASAFSDSLFKRWGALWSRGQRRHSSASSDDGEDVSTNAQGTAEVTIEDVQSLQHAAGPTATTSGIEATGSTLTVLTGAAMIPHAEKANKVGEDAYFISDCGTYFGVSDGVGGWSLSGVDAGEYSRLLMIMAKLFSESARTPPTPSQIMHSAYNQTQVKGSATACILRCLPDEGELHAANLGDSGFLVVRGGNPVFQTPQQQHHFNFPFQLGSKAMGAMNDSPESAQLMQLRILADDIIVTGTDGLFDNVFAEEVASLVTFARKRGDSPALAATVLASYTQMKAADTTHMSPFAYAAQAYGIPYRGGKPDDITVLVSYVSKAGDTTQPDASNGAEPMPDEFERPQSKL